MSEKTVPDVKFMLANRNGALAFFSPTPQSRYEGFFVRRNGKLIKTIESINKKNVAREFSGQRGSFFLEFLLDVGMPCFPHDRNASMCSDILRKCFRNFHIEDDLRSRMLL